MDESLFAGIESELMGRVAVVSADRSNNTYFETWGETGDCTGFYNWVRLWKGRHFSYEMMRQDSSPLLKYAAVILDGHPSHFADMIKIATELKGKVITMFQPEGDISLYDQWGIQSFSAAVYISWNLVDVVIPMEDNEGYYKSLTSSPVRFVSVPIDERMEEGKFLVPRKAKSQNILLYADNNPTGPVAVFGCAHRLNKPLRVVEINEETARIMGSLFKVDLESVTPKLGVYPFLRHLGSSYLHIYPTRNVGTSRESISCACVGTPCISSDRSHTMKRLFPQLMCDVYDVDRMVELATKLYSDADFYDEVVKYAWEHVDHYTIKATKRRFMEAYFLGKNKGGVV